MVACLPRHGAQSIVVGWGDDCAPGKQTDFLRAVDLQADETVVFCWLTWPDKATRDAAYAKMMAQDPAMKGEMPLMARSQWSMAASPRFW